MNLTIVNITEDTLLKDGRTLPAIRVQYKIGDFGPFIDSFPKDGFTAAVVEARAEELRKELRLLVKV